LPPHVGRLQGCPRPQIRKPHRRVTSLWLSVFVVDVGFPAWKPHLLSNRTTTVVSVLSAVSGFPPVTSRKKKVIPSVTQSKVDPVLPTHKHFLSCRLRR